MEDAKRTEEDGMMGESPLIRVSPKFKRMLEKDFPNIKENPKRTEIIYEQRKMQKNIAEDITTRILKGIKKLR